MSTHALSYSRADRLQVVVVSRPTSYRCLSNWFMLNYIPCFEPTNDISSLAIGVNVIFFYNVMVGHGMENGLLVPDNNKTEEVKRLDANYELLISHGVKAASIRTRFFNELGFPRVKISEDHKASCIEHAENISIEDLRSINDALEHKLKLFVLNSNKLVKVHDVATEELGTILASSLTQLEGQGDIGLVPYYPAFPPCASSVPDVLHPVEIINIKENVSAIVLASRRDYCKTINLVESDIKKDSLNSLLSNVINIQSVSAKGMVSEVVLDVLVLDFENERLELRLSEVKGAAAKNIQEFMGRLDKYIYSHLGKMLGRPYDFLKVIRPLYFSSDDNGIVSRLDFLDDDGIERNEKSIRNLKDIRKAPYHQGGALKIDFRFQGFGIKKVWKFDSPSNYKLVIDIVSSANALRAANQIIDSVFLLDCISHSDYNFLLNKVLPS